MAVTFYKGLVLYYRGEDTRWRAEEIDGMEFAPWL